MKLKRCAQSPVHALTAELRSKHLFWGEYLLDRCLGCWALGGSTATHSVGFLLDPRSRSSKSTSSMFGCYLSQEGMFRANKCSTLEPNALQRCRCNVTSHHDVRFRPRSKLLWTCAVVPAAARSSSRDWRVSKKVAPATVSNTTCMMLPCCCLSLLLPCGECICYNQHSSD